MLFSFFASGHLVVKRHASARVCCIFRAPHRPLTIDLSVRRQAHEKEQKFDDIVDKYRRKLESNNQAEKSHRWFDDA